jgi:hypothetical protein
MISVRIARFPLSLLRPAAAALLLCALATGARASDLMGAESCRACHAEAYRIWSESPHAHATEALDDKQRRAPLCLYCHSRDEIRSGQALVRGVSCETCHGGGRFYQADVVMRDKELSHLFGLADLSGTNSAPLCLSCHGGEQAHLKGFDLQAALARIDHWTADRAARKAQSRAQQGPHASSIPNTQLARWLIASAP